MQNWDRIVFLVLAVPLATYQGYVCWQSWRQANYDAAAGAGLLVIATIVLPVLLAMAGG